MPEACRRLRSWHALRKAHKNLGCPCGSRGRGREAQESECRTRAARESDNSRVLGGGKADHMGKATTGQRSPQRKQGMQAPRTAIDMRTSLRGKADKARRDETFVMVCSCEASYFEKPGGRKPPAGICEGAQGKWRPHLDTFCRTGVVGKRRFLRNGDRVDAPSEGCPGCYAAGRRRGLAAPRPAPALSPLGRSPFTQRRYDTTSTQKRHFLWCQLGS